jgi:general secretion pathway protein F
MKTYEYKGFNRNGNACKGLVEALSIKEAREKLISDGILTERISVTGRKLVLQLGDRAVLYRELSSLLGAGFPLIRALDILITSPEMADSNILLAGVRDRVREGSSLADALSAASKSVTPFECAIIQSAERSATVETMLERLATFLEEQEKLRERIKSALLYPSIVLTLGICIAMVMLGVLIPKAREIISGNNMPMPILTRSMIWFGGAVVKWGWLVVIVGIVGVAYFKKRLVADGDFRMVWDRKLFRFPFIGKGRTLLVNLRFARTMAVLIKGGVSLIDAVILAGRATGSEWINQLAEGAAESMRHGTNLSDAIRQILPLSGSLPGWLKVGEASGSIDRLLDNAGQRYQSQWDRYIGTCLGFLEPLLILIIGGFVLLVTLSVLMPIISLTQVVAK